MSNVTLPAASARLLREIAEHDQGSGVTFRHLPRARFEHPNTLAVFNARTFHPLDRHGLVDVGDGHVSPVKVTAAGRAWLAQGGAV